MPCRVGYWCWRYRGSVVTKIYKADDARVVINGVVIEPVRAIIECNDPGRCQNCEDTTENLVVCTCNDLICDDCAWRSYHRTHDIGDGI